MKRNPLKFTSFVHFLRYKFVFWAFSFVEQEFDWNKFKAIVAAPFLEEIVYRGLIFNICQATLENWSMWILPLYFGLAHAHSFLKTMARSNGSFGIELAKLLVKTAYTTLFGAYSGWIFLRSKERIPGGILYGAMFLHS